MDLYIYAFIPQAFDPTLKKKKKKKKTPFDLDAAVAGNDQSETADKEDAAPAAGKTPPVMPNASKI